MKRAYQELSFEILQLTDSYVLLSTSSETGGTGTTGGAFGNEDKDGYQDDFIV